MGIEVVKTCPLGSKCEEVRDGKIFRCAWYVAVKGEHPQTGEVLDTYDCSLSWMPILTLEVARHAYSNGASIESFRNEMIKANQVSNQVLIAAATGQLENPH